MIENVQEMRITKTFRLKGKYLLDLAKAENVNQLASRSGVSYQTMHMWITRPDELVGIKLQTLYMVIVEGLGIPLEEITLADLFEVVDNGEFAE